MNKNLIFVIKANQEFIRCSEDYPEKYAPELNTLFDSISDLYIPLLELFEKWEEKKLDCKIGLVLPPVLCSMLENPRIHVLYSDWLDKRIEFGSKELERCAAVPQKIETIHNVINKYQSLKTAFTDKYQTKLLRTFAEYQRKGYVELLATCGTDIFAPHYGDLPEVISAQVETGLIAYRTFFGELPDGFWLPELGYIPGIEKIIKSYGYSYTILDSRSVLLGETLPSRGIYYPVRTENTLAVFSNSNDFEELCFGEEGYSNNQHYRNEKRDVGFALSSDELETVIPKGSVRFTTGYKYWDKCFDKEGGTLYSAELASKQAEEDALNFLEIKNTELSKAAELIPNADYVCSVCVLNEDQIINNWSEAVQFIQACAENAPDKGITLTSCNSILKKQFALEKIVPYYSAASGEGYGENLLSSKNCWMMRYTRKASERMVDLAERFPNDTGLKTRLLNIGAKELLIAQSSGLAKMVEEANFPGYAEERFRDSIAAFTLVFDSLGSNTVSTEWLTTLEARDDLFPWMNYRIFSKKQ